MPKAASKEVEKAVTESTGEILSMDALNSLFGVPDSFVPNSIEELEEYWEQQGGLITFQGSPYDVIKKDELVGEHPFVIVDVRFYNGKFGEACAVMAHLTETGRNVVFNDGSTGVKQQIRYAMQRSGRKGGFRCKGLRASTYTYQEKDFDTNPIGPEIPATTYYIA